MVENRPAADRILIARLTGTARRLAGWRGLAGDEEAAAVAELRKLAAGRADLLAEVAGVEEGACADELSEPLARAAARLCRLAGAEENCRGTDAGSKERVREAGPGGCALPGVPLG